MKSPKTLQYYILSFLFSCLIIFDTNGQCGGTTTVVTSSCSSGDITITRGGQSSLICEVSTASTNVCQNTEYTISSANAVIYQWTAAVTETSGSYAGLTTITNQSSITVKFTSTGPRDITIGDCVFRFEVLGSPVAAAIGGATDICDNVDVVFTSSCASGTCTGLTYAWVYTPLSGGAAITGTQTATSTVAEATTPPGEDYSVALTLTNDQTDAVGTGTGCLDNTQSTTFMIRERPVLGALTFGTPTLNNTYKALPIGDLEGEICIDGTQPLSIACTANCPTGANGTYQWYARNNDETLWSGANTWTSGQIASSGGTVSASSASYTYTPNTGWWSGGGWEPRLFDVLVQVRNDYGCWANAWEDNSLQVNDKPEVFIIYDDNPTGAANWVSGGSYTVCTGMDMEFRVNGCDHSDYISLGGGNVSNPNLSLTANPNVTTGSGNIPYTSPCDGGNGTHFKKLTWTALGEDGVSAITVDASSIGSGTNVSTNPNNDAKRTGFVTASLTGATGTLTDNVVTYSVTVEGENACTNTDNITVTTQSASILFKDRTQVPGTTITGGPPVEIEQCLGFDQKIRPISTNPTTNGGGTIAPGSSTYQWYYLAGANSGTVSGTSNYEMTTDVLSGTVNNVSEFQVSVTDQYGCTGTDFVNVKAVAGPELTITSPGACEGSPVELINTMHTSGYTYDVYDGDPAGGPPSPNQVVTGETSATMTIPNPVDGTTYYVVVKSGNCQDTKTFVVNMNKPPVWVSRTSFGLSYPSWASTCNDVTQKIVAEAENGDGSGSGGLTYTWTGYGETQSGTAVEATDPMGVVAGGGGSSGYFTWVFSGWFPILVWVPGVAGEQSYSFYTGHPQQEWGNPLPGDVGAGVNLVVEDANGCTITDSWEFDIIECGVPNMTKAKSLTPSGTETIFSTYGCLEDYVHLDIDIPGTYSYTPIYEWRIPTYAGVISTASSYVYRIQNSDPDTLYTVCIVYSDTTTDPKAVVKVLFDTTVISRGFVTLFPDGDNNIGTADSTICLNEVLEAQANCTPCRGNVEYVWDNKTSGNTYGNGNIWDSYLYGAGVPLDTLHVDLVIRHGEFCLDTFNRQVYTHDLPSITLAHNGSPVVSPIYLCDGATEVITIDASACLTCDSSTYVWNTAANTLSINVNSQGGYFAELIDSNSCLGVTNTALVIDATVGLNSPVTANPTQICSGGNVTLEVAPCIGCSYVWYDTSGSVVAATRTTIINTVGAYYAMVTNAEGCSYPTAILSVTATAVTSPTIAGTTDSICLGQSSTLSTPPIAGALYQWYLEGNIISGASTTSYNAIDSGQYTVAVTYPNGCIETSSGFNVFDVSFKPNILASSTVVCSGSTADLSTDLHPGWTYQWYDDGIIIPGATGSIYSATTPGSHYVEVTTDYNCTIRSDSLNITTSSLSIPNATTSTPTVCPGEFGVVSVSLCADCSYQWFNANTGLAETNDSSINYRYNTITTTGAYYAIVSGGGCSETSDTVNVDVNAVLTPAINTSSTVVCDGRTALLITPSCVGCTYHWLVDTLPVLGAINDTFHLVDDVYEIGDYQISIDYPNGCTDTSAILSITDGSDTVSLVIAGSAPLDSVICNGVGETLTGIPSSSLTGTYLYTLYLDNTPVTGYSNVTLPTFPGDSAGVYTVQMVNPLGCRALSNILPLREVDVAPVLTSTATSDPSSVTATAICTDEGTVYLEVSNCPTCSFMWTLSGDTLGYTGTTYTSLQGDTATGIYIVTGTEDGCAAVSNPITVANLIGSINSNANTADTSICNGQSVTLEHAASITNPLDYVTASFRWLRTPNAPPTPGSPINGASNSSYITGTPGTYYLELTTAQGCVDTSDFIIVRQVDPPTGFLLKFDTLAVPGGVGTPLSSNGTPIDMNNWVFPPTARNGAPGVVSYFTSAPFNGALPADAGLIGVDSINFDPHDSLAGYHLITYHYDTLGCEFTVQDVLEILPPASISVTNANPASVPYEACVGDDLTITTTYLDYPIDQVWAFDANGDYGIVPLTGVPLVTLDTFGADTVYNTTLVFSVPGSANASYLMLINSAGPDTTFTPFVLIHNTDLSFTGLPNMLCSNSSGITLYGNPSGGTFSIRDTSILHNVFLGGALGDTIYPAMVPVDSFSNGNQWVDVFYSYTETYTNGNLCPSFDTVSQQIEVKDVRLTGIQYNPISVSQDQELLTNLVYRTFPYEARPNKQPLYTSTFSGSFTSPAGNPLNFLPKNAGVGNHPLTYSIQSGDCINSVTADISVIPAPTVIPIPDTLCRNNGAVPFCRDLAYSYLVPGALFVNGVTSFTDTANIINITSVNGNGALTVTNSNPGPGGISECYTYDPALLPNNVQHDTLIIEYWFHRDEDTLDIGGVAIDFDTLDYVIARIYQPIFIDTLVAVSIDTVVRPFYCEEDVLHLLSGTPSNNALGGGVFTLFGGNNQYATGDTLHNNVINPFLVNGADSATTTYNLIYTLDGFACKNSDSMNVTISKGLYPAFNTISGMTEFCDTDPDEVILHNVVAPDTAIWKIGGIPQASYVFPPDPLDPGIHVVELQAIDIYGCTASVLDTFTINALPALAMTPGLATQYCANDPIVDFTVSPSPGCPSYLAPGQYLIDEYFDSGLNPVWLYYSGAGAAWIHTTINGQGTSAGAAMVDTSSVIDDSWMLSDSLDMIAGHTYRLTYMVRTGDPHPACTGLCDASIRVMFGTSLNPLNPASTLSATMDFNAIVQSDDTYIRYEVEHYHDPAIYSSGKHFMGFHCFSPPYARSLRVDNVRFRDITIGNCNMNGIGYVTGPGVVHDLLDSAYIFNPLAVTPGNVEVKYIYTDIKGCQDSLVYPVTVDSFPIVSFTDMDPSYCENLPTIQLLGSPLGGTFSATLYAPGNTDSNLVHVPFFAPIDTAWYPVNYLTNVPGIDYVTYSYTDGHGCTSSMTDTVTIIPMLDSAIIDNALDPFGIGHCVNAAPTVLNYVDFTGSTVPGVFYGPGVRGGLLGPGAAMFHPDSAVIDMGHTGNVTITYIYLTSTGCPDTTRFTTEVHAMPNLSFMNLPDSMCLNADSLQVVVINSIVTGPLGMTYIEDTLANQTGTFVVTDTSGLLVPNFIVLFDSLVPANANGYSQINVQYTYTADTSYGGCTSVINDSIRVDTIPNAYFQGMQDFYCENEPASILMAFPPYKVGSGYMLIDTVPAYQIDSSFMWIDPAAMVGGVAPNTATQVYPMYYTYTDTRGCTGEVWDTFEVRPFPRITFSPTFQDTFCRTNGTYDLMSQIITPKGGYFTDNLALTSIIQDTLLNLNSVAGPRLVTYHFVDTTTACYNNDSIWLYLFNSPELDFTAYGGCAAMDIIFDGYATNLIDGIDSITSIEWDFNTPSTVDVSPLDTSPVTLPDYLHQYAGPGIYNVTLYVQNQGNCVASVAKDVIVSPSVSLNYFEDFESGSGDWYADQPISTTPNPLWSYSTSLAGTMINDPGNSAWVVLPDSMYGKGQSGWVYSPCFDFTNSLRPMIVFDLWRDALEDIDGIVMEWYNYTTNEWDLLGDKDLGINWYQSDFVLSRPGNQVNTTYPRGWTGRSNGFEKARFKLDRFKGRNNVRLRLAFASSPQTVIDTTGSGYEGAAFDNVWIGERTRNVLVEHFDNVYYVSPGGQNSDVVDQSVYNKVFNTAYGLDVFLVQYQTEITSAADFVNLQNDADPSARTYLYGINDDNQIMIDGRSIGTGISQDLSTYDMDYDMLQFPDFDITITTPVITGNSINVTSTVTALVDKVQADYAVHTVIIQDSSTINSNGFDMLSVMRKMLPDASGQTYNQSWAIGNSVTAGESWDFTNELGKASFDPNQLEVIVFIQDMNTKEVFQVQSTQDLNKYIGVGKIEDDVTAEILNMNVYPNPSSDLFNVEFDEELVGDYDWRVVDVTGRILQTGTVNSGTRKFRIDAERLAPGAYYFVINSETVYAQRKLIVIK